MEFQHFFRLVGQKRKTVYGIIALFLVAAVVIVAVQRFRYSSQSQLLIVQEQTAADAYTASKSSEYLSRTLASVVTSNSFYNKVMETSFGVDASYFGNNPKDQMKEWERTVSARSINDSGAIAVTVYHPSRLEAEKILRAVNYVLMTQHTAYHGQGDSVKIRLIDQPVTSSFPVRPNIALIAGLALALGLVCGLMYVYLSAGSELAAHEILPYPAAPAPHPFAPEAYRYDEGSEPVSGRAPYYPAANIHGQLPEEAVAHLHGRHHAARHVPRPAELSPYGNHSRVAVHAPDQESDREYIPHDPEDIRLQGNMSNVIR